MRPGVFHDDDEPGAAAVSHDLCLARDEAAAQPLPGAADPGLEDDAEDHPERRSQDRHLPQRRAGPAGRRGWALSV